MVECRIDPSEGLERPSQPIDRCVAPSDLILQANESGPKDLPMKHKVVCTPRPPKEAAEFLLINLTSSFMLFSLLASSALMPDSLSLAVPVETNK